MTSAAWNHWNVRGVKLHCQPVIIEVTGDIDQSMAAKFCSDIQRAETTGQSEVMIIINSNGGDVYALMAMLEGMRACNIPVATLVQGFAASCAAILFACGTRGYRFIAPGARIMLHDVSQMMFGQVDLLEMEISQKELKLLNRTLYTGLAQACSQPDDYFLSLIKSKSNRDLYISADEAASHQMCDFIGIPRMCHEVSFKTWIDLSECKSSQRLPGSTPRKKMKVR